MNRRFTVAIALWCAGAGLLTACSGGGTVSGSPSPESSSAPPSTGEASSSASAPASSADVPKVQNPLPASVLDGSPCDSALTAEQVASFVGAPQQAPDRDDAFVTGPACTWFGSGQISVFYGTKAGGGMNLEYQNLKPKSKRWEPTEIQGYPAVAYTGKNEDQSITGSCGVSVGIRDDVTFGVSLALGDSARKRGVDSCEGVKDVANTVLTNLKGRS